MKFFLSVLLTTLLSLSSNSFAGIVLLNKHHLVDSEWFSCGMPQVDRPGKTCRFELMADCSTDGAKGEFKINYGDRTACGGSDATIQYRCGRYTEIMADCSL